MWIRHVTVTVAMSQKTTENSEQLCISVNLGKTLKKPLKNSETPKYTSEKLWYSKNHWKLWTTLYLSKPLKNSEKTFEKLWNTEIYLWKLWEPLKNTENSKQLCISVNLWKTLKNLWKTLKHRNLPLKNSETLRTSEKTMKPMILANKNFNKFCCSSLLSKWAEI